MTQTPKTSKNRPPAWLNGAIVLVVLLLGLYAVYYFVFTPEQPKPKVISPSNTPSSPFNLTGRTGRNTTRPANITRGGGNVRQQQPPIISILSGNPSASTNSPITYTYDESKGVGKIKVRHENVVLTADYEGPARGGRAAGGGDRGGASSRNPAIANLSFDYSTDLMMSWVKIEEMNLHTLAWRVTNTPSMATAAGITNDQRRQLDALSYRPRLTNAEDAQLKNLLYAWVLTPDAAASNQVLNAVRTISKTHLEDTKASFLARVVAIPKILTPEQIANLKNR